MSDVIELRGLAVDTVIGIHDWERRVRQRLLIDLDLPTDARGTEDDLGRSVDYDAVAQATRAFVVTSERRLIEALADDLAGHLIATFDLPWIEVCVDKPGAVADCGHIRLRIRRER